MRLEKVDGRVPQVWPWIWLVLLSIAVWHGIQTAIFDGNPTRADQPVPPFQGLLFN